MESKRRILEICCDASIKRITNDRVFGCAGIICINDNTDRYRIIPDTTNNKAELIAIYESVLLAHEYVLKFGNYDDIIIYSDSKNAVFGLREWMSSWLLKTDYNGVMYGSNNKPVENQEYYSMIISYIITNNLYIKFRHQKGHINHDREKDLNKAYNTFVSSNGYSLSMDDIIKISIYNSIVDNNSRILLYKVNPEDYPVSVNDGISIADYIIDNIKYKKHIL